MSRPGARGQRVALRAAAGAAGALCLLAACSSGSSGSATTPPSAVTSDGGAPSTTAAPPASAPSSQPASAPSSASPASPATQDGAAAPPCTGSALRVTVGRVDAGAGQRNVPVVFTNVSAAACTLRGYPGVAGLDAAGRQLTQAERQQATSTAVRLAPGGSASAAVHAAAIPSGTATACPGDYRALLVTPPDTRMSTRVTVTLPWCGGLSVRPVVPGTTGIPTG